MKIKLIVTTLVAMLVLSTGVMAANSPTADTYHTVSYDGETVSGSSSTTIKATGGKVTVSSGTIKAGEEVTITAEPNDGKEFSKWVITGDYTIVSGSLTDEELVIVPNGDIDISAAFINEDGEVEEEEPTTKGNDSSTSPKTGHPVLPVALAFTAALGLGLVSTKKAFR